MIKTSVFHLGLSLLRLHSDFSMYLHLFAFIFSSLPAFISSQCVLYPDLENVVSTQLEGDWEINPNLTTVLWPDYLNWIQVNRVTFTNNPGIVDALPEEDCQSWMADMNLRLFMSGEMSFYIENDTNPEPVSFPYVLTILSGNPHIIYWQDEMTDTESFNLMMARADDPKNDLLFIGGDFK